MVAARPTATPICCCHRAEKWPINSWLRTQKLVQQNELQHLGKRTARRKSVVTFSMLSRHPRAAAVNTQAKAGDAVLLARTFQKGEVLSDLRCIDRSREPML